MHRGSLSNKFYQEELISSLIGGVDLGGTKIVVALVDHEGIMHARSEIRGHRGMASDAVVERIAAVLQELFVAAGVDGVSRVGIATSGHVDHLNGRVITNSNLPGFDDYPIGRRLSELMQLPVRVDNDANAQAFAEFLFGNARGFNPAVFVTVSTGIGAGIVLDGRLYRGRTGTAGEFGHMLVNPASTVRCGCGNYGCLMSHASGLALPQVVRQRVLQPGVETDLDVAGLRDSEINGELISRGLAAGDSLCRDIVNEYADYLGIGLYNLFQVLDPAVIVVGGGLTNWGDAYVARVETRFHRMAGTMMDRPVPVRPAALKADAAVIGAAALALEEEAS